MNTKIPDIRILICLMDINNYLHNIILKDRTWGLSGNKSLTCFLRNWSFSTEIPKQSYDTRNINWV